VRKLSETQDQVLQLLQAEPVFGTERIKGALADYQRLAAPVQKTLGTIKALREDLKEHSTFYRKALLQLVSLECAAGAEVDRCRAWFTCLAELACRPLPGTGQPIDPVEAVTYFALAANFATEIYTTWPEDLETQQTSERVLYHLMTGKPIPLPETDPFFDGPHWLRLYRAIMTHTLDEAQTASIGLADWWLREYRVSEVPVYDPEEYPCFEPVCNAVLAVALLRERMPIAFVEASHKQFYIAALMS